MQSVCSTEVTALAPPFNPGLTSGHERVGPPHRQRPSWKASFQLPDQTDQRSATPRDENVTDIVTPVRKS